MVHAPAADLCTFVDSSPSPFHAAATAAAELEAGGFVAVDPRDAWPTEPGRYLVVKGGTLIAWSTYGSTGPTTPFRLVGGHTDSPNLRLKQHHDLSFLGLGVVALEPYGGPLLHTWFDRDLGLSGRLGLRDGSEVLVRVDEPLLRVPSLAIHLSEQRDGVTPNRQSDLDAVWTLGGDADVLDVVAAAAGVPRGEVLGHDLMTHDVQPSGLVGSRQAFVSAPRLDNQGTCFAGTRAMLAAPVVEGVVPVLALFDHEEVGSMSERGAQSSLLSGVLERIVRAAGGSADDVHRALAASLCASGDMAHATHPNHAARHERLHRIEMGGGPVLKVNQNMRYASDAPGSAAFAVACEQADVPLQRYVHRADLPCGSTIGPLSAAQTSITTVDVGAPQLAMHSAREHMAVADVPLYASALEAFLAPAGN